MLRCLVWISLGNGEEISRGGEYQSYSHHLLEKNKGRERCPSSHRELSHQQRRPGLISPRFLTFDQELEYLIIVNIITSPSISSRKERNPSSQSKATNPYSRNPSSNNRDSLALQILVNINPVISRLNTRFGLISINGNFFHIRKVDSDAPVDIRSSSKSGMATAFQGELTIELLDDENCGGDIFGGKGRDATSWSD